MFTEGSSYIRYHLDRDNQLIVRIMSLVPSIRLYFASSVISGISEPHKLDRASSVSFEKPLFYHHQTSSA
jgi:hypothetical protein